MQTRLTFRSGLLLALLALCLVPRPAAAQLFGRSEPAGDTAELLLRIDRLENQIRSVNGQLEQMQFQLRRSEDMLKKFQQDVDFRFQEQAGKGGPRPPQNGGPPPPPPQRRSDLEPEIGNPVAEVIPAPAGVPRAPVALGPATIGAGMVASATPRNGRNDAFDPAANPDAPGAPRTLGSQGSASTPLARAPYPSGPLGAEEDPNAPLDLNSPRQRRNDTAVLAPANPGIAPPATTPKDEFELAVFSLEQGQFEAAEAGFKGFLQRYPKDQLSGEAVYYLGESFFKRGKHRDAAEQYLKISTDYPKTAHAPDAMLRLGLSLEKLGAKEQACAFFAEVPRKFPAAATVKVSAQREAKRAQC